MGVIKVILRISRDAQLPAFPTVTPEPLEVTPKQERSTQPARGPEAAPKRNPSSHDGNPAAPMNNRDATRTSQNLPEMLMVWPRPQVG